MTDLEDHSWVFDSLICFLNGPVWNAPLQSFIEDKSLIFEPLIKEDAEYKKIHDEFKNLVDLMLGSYMEDMGITPELFQDACNNGMHTKLPGHFQENLFEQIWAANDYEMFKRMMIQKNIELQLQALELIEQKYGITPRLFQLNKTSSTSYVEPDVVTDIHPLTSLSISNKPPSEKKVLVEVIKQCEVSDKNDMPTDGAYLKEEKQHLEHLRSRTSSVSESEENYNKKDSPIVEFQKVDDEEIRKRQLYLKAQRDKLVALKKQVRKKHLDVEMGMEQSSKLRPRSAKVAEAALNSGTALELNTQPKTLEFRKALAERLRIEVISKASDS